MDNYYYCSYNHRGNLQMDFELSARQKYLTFIRVSGGEGMMVDYKELVTFFSQCISNFSPHFKFYVISKRQLNCYYHDHTCYVCLLYTFWYNAPLYNVQYGSSYSDKRWRLKSLLGGGQLDGKKQFVASHQYHTDEWRRVQGPTPAEGTREGSRVKVNKVDVIVLEKVD